MLEVSQNPSSRSALIDPAQGPGPSRVWFRFFQDVYRFTATAFAQVIKTDSTAVAAATPTAVTFSAISHARRITLDSTKVYVTTEGLFNIQLSGQLVNSGAADTVVVWIKVNNADVANSARQFIVPASGNATLTFDFFTELTAGDYFEIYFYALNATAQLTTIASGAYPQTPAIILTVSQVL